jgi:phage tail sheath gpL-like
MADLIFNIAKGRFAELQNRVQANDPAASTIVVVPVDRGATSDATIKDFATLAAALAGGLTERTTGGWNRKTLTDSTVPASTVDNSGDRMLSDLPDQTWTAVSTGAVTDLLVCYSPSAGADSTIVPCACLAFAITPDGSDVVWQVNASGWAQAS